MSKSIKLCDDCGKKPFKAFVQLEGSYKLICADCSRKQDGQSAVEQWVDYDDAEVIDAF